MPVHRVHTSKEKSAEDALTVAIRRAENQGEAVVQVIPWGGGWMLVTARVGTPEQAAGWVTRSGGDGA